LLFLLLLPLLSCWGSCWGCLPLTLSSSSSRFVCVFASSLWLLLLLLCWLRWAAVRSDMLLRLHRDLLLLL
jgi:hypothetical protein